MSAGRIIRFIFIPAVLGLVATFLVYTYVSKPGGVLQEVKTVQVVVAATAIPAKTILTAEMLAHRPMPETFVTPGTITDVREALGRVTVAPLADGEMLLQTKLSATDTLSGLAAHVPRGMRAVTIGIGDVSGVAGLVQPGDRVDVIVTFSDMVAEIHRTRLVLEAVPVLAVGTLLEAATGVLDGSRTASNTMTLGVTPDEAILLTLADEMGKLRLALRPSKPERAIGERELTMERFREPPPQGVPFALKEQVSLTFSLWEVDINHIRFFGLRPNADLSLARIDSEARGLAERLEEQGLARELTRSDTLVMDRDVAVFALEGTVEAREGSGSMEMVSWLSFGLRLKVIPVAYSTPFFDLDIFAEVQEIQEGRAGEAHSTVKRTNDGTVRVEPWEIVALGGIYPRESDVRYVLPKEYLSEEVKEGSRELVVLIEPSIPPR